MITFIIEYQQIVNTILFVSVNISNDFNDVFRKLKNFLWKRASNFAF